MVFLLENNGEKWYNANMDSVSSEYLIKTRRKLHALAEISGAEYNTQAFIADELKRLGCRPQRIATGVYCDIGHGKPRLALRADIDALPITENTAVTKMTDCAAESAMHACGHDGHTANLLNVARILGGKSKTPVRLIFQFGEEGVGGSLAMIDGGVLDGVDEIYALHLCPELEQGKIGYCYGGMFAGCSEFDLIFAGRASHCAMPEKGADAIRAAVAVADAAYGSAKANGLLINLGKITGGACRNVVAAESKSEYTLRFYDMAKCEAVMMDIERAALKADDVFGTEHKLVSSAVYPPLINDALAVDKVRALMGDVCVAVEPRYTAEDFSNYLQKVGGCMVWLGIKTDRHASPLHSDTFSFDENALLVGTELFLKLIESRLA